MRTSIERSTSPPSWNTLTRIVDTGPSHHGDLEELAAKVHDIQNTVLAQAAARAYPDRYRLLGGSLTRMEVKS